MTAYAFVTVTVTNPDSFAKYREVAGAALAKYDGAPVEVSREAQVIEGERTAPSVAVLLSFPDREAALGWINDPEFADVHALRQGAGESDILLL